MSNARAAPFARTRKALLALLAAAVAALSVLYWFGRQRSEPPVDAAPARESRAPGVVATSGTFDYTQNLGGKPVFRIRGEKFRALADGKIELDQVALSVYREGKALGLSSREAVYAQERSEATLTGDAHAALGPDWSVSSDAFDLSEGGNRLRSRGAVAFQLPDGLTGSASGLDADIRTERYRFGGPVVVEGTRRSDGTPVSFHAGFAAYDRGQKRFHAETDVELRVGEQSLKTAVVDLYLTDDEKNIAIVRARGGAEGDVLSTVESAAGGDGATPAKGGGAGDVHTHYAGKTLNASWNPATHLLWQVELDGEEGVPATLRSEGPGGIVRVVEAGSLSADLADGKPASADARNGSTFSEFVSATAARPSRRATADALRAEFDPGETQPARVALRGRVHLDGDGYRGEGDRGLYDLKSNRGELLGKRAVVTSDRGEIASPHIVLDGAKGLLEADAPVQAVLSRDAATSLSGSVLGGRGPVRVEAEHAILLQKPQSFVFRGNVRAFQGEDVLFADQLHGEEQGDRLSAAGFVRTVLQQDAKEGKPRDPPIVISSNTMAYSGADRKVVYTGPPVEVRQGARKLTCDELTGYLGAEKKIERFHAQGNVRLDDPAAGKSAEASEADYDLAGKSMTLTGEKVIFRDATGNVVRGKKLIYDIEQGTAHLAGAPGEP